MSRSWPLLSSVTPTLLYKSAIFKWGRVVRETMGEQESPKLRGPLPFHTLPQQPPPVLTSSEITVEGGTLSLCVVGRICYSLIPEEWQVPIVFILSVLHCHDSFPYLHQTGCGGELFSVTIWHFLLYSLCWTLFKHHWGISKRSIFKGGPLFKGGAGCKCFFFSWYISSIGVESNKLSHVVSVIKSNVSQNAIYMTWFIVFADEGAQWR